nr:SDR family NAD(P)-dependent oxidoreductase [Faunimonas pinastri]
MTASSEAAGTQRVNRAALPHMRSLRAAQTVWVGSSSARGGRPPFPAPYFAAKGGMDALAQSYALELARFGIETTIVVPGAVTKGTEHFANAGHPGDARSARDSTGRASCRRGRPGVAGPRGAGARLCRSGGGSGGDRKGPSTSAREAAPSASMSIPPRTAPKSSTA